MGRRRDAALALVVLVPVVGAGIALGAPLDPVAATLGAAGALVLELALSRRRSAVRRVWERRVVRAGSVVAALTTATVLAVVVPRASTVLAGGLVAYLALLGTLSARDRL